MPKSKPKAKYTGGPLDLRKEKGKGKGSYWYDEARKLHYYRVIVQGQTYLTIDTDPYQAYEKFEKLREELVAGIDVKRRSSSIEEWLLYYGSTVYAGRDLHPATLPDFSKRVELYILSYFKDHALQDITADLGRSWMRWATFEKKWARSSRKRALAIMKDALDLAVAEKLLSVNPFTHVRLVEQPQEISDDDEFEEHSHGIGKPMTSEDLDAFFNQLHRWRGGRAGSGRPEKTYRLYALYALAMYGLRRGELLGLRVKDYSREKKKIRVVQQVVAIDGVPTISVPKTRTSVRTLDISDDMCAILDSYLADREDLRTQQQAKGQWFGDEYDLMFCADTGRPMSPSNLLRQYRNILRQAGLVDANGKTRYRFHDLRHTANQLLHEEGIDSRTRAALLGQAGAKVNEEIYTHTSSAAKKAAAAKVKVPKNTSKGESDA